MARRVKIELILDAKGVVKGVKTADGALGKLETRTTGLTKGMSTFKQVLGGLALGAIARQAQIVGKQLFEMSTRVEETGSKFQTTFEDGADAVDAFGKSFANMAGLTQTQFRDLASTSGAILRGMGAQMGDVVHDTERIVRLAGDIASFHNVAIDEAFTALRAGLVGESEPLRRFGILIDEAATKQRALVETGKESEKQLTQLEKAQARLNLIYERAGKVVGDLERTQNSAANRARKLDAEIRDLAEAFAEKLRPAIEQTLDVMEFAMEDNAETMEAWTEKAADLVIKSVDMANQLSLAALKISELAGEIKTTNPALSKMVDLFRDMNIITDIPRQLELVRKGLKLFNKEQLETIRRQKLSKMFLSAHNTELDLLGDAADDLTEDPDKGLPKVTTLFQKMQEDVRDLTSDLQSLRSAGLPALIELEREAASLERQMSTMAALVQAVVNPQKVEGKPGILSDEIAGQLKKEQDKSRMESMAASIPLREMTDAQIAEMERLETAIVASSERINVLLAALAESNAEVLATTFGNFATAIEQIGGRSLAAYKAFAIAEAIAATYLAANKALASAPPPFNYALMASVIAVGLANVAAIARAKKGSSSTGAGAARASGGDTTGDTGAALGGIRVQNRGFTTGAMGAAREARAPELTIRVIEPDLFTLSNELTNADNIREQVGNV